MLRKVPAVAALCAFSLVAGCAQLQGLLSPENLSKAQEILKQAGVSLSFKDPKTGETVNIKSKEDVKEIKNAKGEVLKEGVDYKFENGKLIFPKLGQKEKITITRPDGTTFQTEVEPGNEDQRARFIPNANGEFGEIDEDVDFDQAFKDQQERDKAHRVTVTLGATWSFAADAVLGLAQKPPCPQGQTQCPPGFILPDIAVNGVDGGVAFDVQALGDATPPGGMQPPPIKDITWILAYKTGDKIHVVRFNILKTDLKRVDMPDPGQPFDPSEVVLPDAQTVSPAEIKVTGEKDYDDEDAAIEGEGVEEFGQPMPPPDQQM